MKTQISIYRAGNIDESCNGVNITIETQDYDVDTTSIYNRAIAELVPFLKSLKDWNNFEGKPMRKVEMEVRDYTDRDHPMGNMDVTVLQNHGIHEADNKAQ